MKVKELTSANKLPAGYTINPDLNGKYADDPLIQVKAARAADLLKAAGLPRPELRNPRAK